MVTPLGTWFSIPQETIFLLNVENNEWVTMILNSDRHFHSWV